MAMMRENALTYALPAPIATLERDEENVPPEALHYFSDGVSLFQQEKYQEALEAFEEALKAIKQALSYEEYLAKAWYNKGVTLLQMEDFQEALTALQRALKYDKEHPQAYYSSGVALIMLGRLPEAQQVFQRAFILRDSLSNRGVGLYKAWSLLTLQQGLDALLSQNIRAFKEAGLKYIDILEKAEQERHGPGSRRCAGPVQSRFEEKEGTQGL